MNFQSFFDNFALLADAPNGVVKLRQLILQLAVEGKLVSQDPRDEAAFALFERIKRDKSKLIKRKKNRKTESSIPFDEESVPFTLPISWVWCRLVDLGITQTGTTPPTSKGEYFGNDYPFIKPADITNNGINYDRHGLSSLGCKVGRLVPADSVLMVSIGGSIGKVGIVDRDCSCNQQINYITLQNGVTPKLLYYYMKSPCFQAQVISLAPKTTLPILSKGKWDLIYLPLPPLEEQKRIVAKVDELMLLCDELERRQQAKSESRVRLNNVTLAPLNNAASLLPEEFKQSSVRLSESFKVLYESAETVSKLRSTILLLAVQGRLVPQDPNDQRGHELLRRINAEKERLIKEKRIKRSAPPLPLNLDETPFDLPSGWTWARFGDVSFNIEAGWSPQCERRHAENDEWGVLKVSSVSWDKFNPDENKALPKDVKPRTELEVRSGDFLLSRANTAELVAKSVVVQNTRSNLLLSDKVLRIHLPNYVDKQFYNYFNNSQTARDYYARTASGTSSSMKNISQEGIFNLPVVVPPLSEQNRIVAKVNDLMALCDELETKLRQAEADSETLMNAAVQHVLASLSGTSNTTLARVSA